MVDELVLYLDLRQQEEPPHTGVGYVRLYEDEHLRKNTVAVAHVSYHGMTLKEETCSSSYVLKNYFPSRLPLSCSLLHQCCRPAFTGPVRLLLHAYDYPYSCRGTNSFLWLLKPPSKCLAPIVGGSQTEA